MTIAFSLAVLLSLSRAQCNLEELGSELVSKLNQAGHIPEADPLKFTLQDLTYLCFVQLTNNNTVIYQVCVSLLYSFNDVVMNQTAQDTVTLCVGETVMFAIINNSSLTQDLHHDRGHINRHRGLPKLFGLQNIREFRVLQL